MSRAYYAAFWHLRTAVEERFGTLDAEGPDVHRELFRVVQLWDPDVARNLMTLRLDRNRADYEPRSAVSVVAASRGVSAAFAILRA